MSEWMMKLNPLAHMEAGDYESFWHVMFSTVLLGFWGRLIAAGLLLLAFWFGVRRRNFAGGVFCFLVAASIAYGAAILNFLGMLNSN
ncbi:hypothetical protein [Geoalkalibacter halelectricus]|uniref:hypothetical protein n=1 Tax=Geoalkalibacter halelectricus TaxID=2847045 RepID=UPI00266F96DA|nr:hypothetical protein [Geoalkalibacter halelectricus]MDO3380344.1 hypothetical protein [Geoalkalibacter halelectricus]